MATLQTILATPWLLVTAATLLGLAVGSFLNVVIYRLPRTMARGWREQSTEVLAEWAAEDQAPAETRQIREPIAALQRTLKSAPRFDLVSPRSACPSCGRPITAIENVPVLSWIVLGGRCAGCKARISLRYPCVEILTALLSAWVAWRFNADLPALAAGLIFVWSMIAVAFIDLDTMYVPHEITEPLLWAGILLSLGTVFEHADPRSSIIGAAAGYLSFWVLAKAWSLLRKVESMGQGDFKLLAIIGSWFGWQMLPQAIFLSAFAGACVGVTLIVAGRGDLSTKIPFGPYLAIAGTVAMLHGPDINRYYFRLGYF